MTEHSEEVTVLVDAAVNAFRAALTSHAPVLKVAIGLDYLCRATACATQPHPLTDDPEAMRLLSRLMTILVGAVSPYPTAEQISFGLGCANALLIAAPDEYHIDRLLYAGQLLAALRGWLCQAELQRRGDPLMRAIHIRRAMDTPHTPGSALQ